MASRGKISELFDVVNIQGQYDKVIGLIQAFVKKVDEGNAAKIGAKEATKPSEQIDANKEQEKYNQELTDVIKQGVQANEEFNQSLAESGRVKEEFTGASKEAAAAVQSGTQFNYEYSNSIEDNIAKQFEYKNKLSELSDSLKQLKKDRDLLENIPGNEQAKKEIEDRIKAYTQEQAAIKISNQELTKYLNAQIKDSQAVEGSRNEAIAAINLLKKERDDLNLTTEEGRVKQKTLNDEIDRQNNFLKETASLLEKQKINVGNYQGSAKIIVDALKEVEAEITNLQQKQKGLQDLTSGRTVVKGFGKGSEGNTQAAAKELEKVNAQLGFAIQKSEALQQVTSNPKFLNFTAKVGDATQEVRLFTQRLIDLENAGLKNSEVYRQVEARLAQLADQVSDTREKIKALGSDTRAFDLFSGAINTVASGFQVASGAAALFGKNEEDVQRSIQKLVAIQNIATGAREIATELTKKGTLANKAYSFVTAQVAIVTNAASTATARFNAILKLSGIGLLITGIGYLISKLDIFSSSTKKATDEAEKLNTALSDIYETEKSLTDLLSKDPGITNNILLLKQQLSYYEASGASQTKLFAIKKKIAAEEKSLTDAQLQDLIFRAETEEFNNDQYLTGVDAIEAAQEHFYNQSLIGETELNKLRRQRARNEKTLTKEQLETYDNQIKSQENYVEVVKKSFNDYNSIITKSLDNKNSLDKIETEQLKFNADERRKLLLETARIEAETIITNNEAVINSEKSTLEQRIESLKSISIERKKIIEAEKQNIVKDPSKAGTADIPIAIKKAKQAEEKINSETDKAIERTREDFRIRDLTAVTGYNQKQLELISSVNQELYKSTLLSFDERLSAQQKYLQSQRDIAEAEYRLKLQQAGILDTDIEALAKDRKFKVTEKKITDEELRALQLEHENKMLQIITEGSAETADIIISDFDNRKQIIEKGLAEIERAQESSDVDSTKKYSEEIIALNNSFAGKKISIEKYERERLKIERKFQNESINNLISIVEKQLTLITFNDSDELAAKQRLEEEKQALIRSTTDEEKKQSLERIKIAQDEYDKVKEINDKKKGLEKSLAEARKDASDQAKQNSEEQKKKIIDDLKEIAEAANSIFSTIAGLIGASVDKQKNVIQDQIDALDKQKEKEIEIANQTILNEQNKAAAIAVIEARAASQKEALERKQRQLDQQRARFEKAASIFRLTLLLAEAIATLNLLKIIAASGQLAVAIATPIPRFRFGGEQKEDGLAIVGDAYKAEAVKYPDGTVIKTPATPTVMDLPKGTKIFPDFDKMVFSSTLTNAPEFNNKTIIDNKEVVRGLKLVERAVKKIPQTSITVQNPLKQRIRYGSSINDHITRNIGK